MNFYLDTEFWERNGIVELISIGIKCENGQKLYAENSRFNWDTCTNQWLHENVKNHLRYHGKVSEWSNLTNEFQQKFSSSAFGAVELIDSTLFFEANLPTIGDVIKDWVEQQTKEPPVFYAYYGAYDWVAFMSCFGYMMNQPKGWPMYQIDLKQMMDSYYLTKEWKHEMCPDPEGEHHALVDAEWNEKLHQAIKSMLEDI